MKRMYTLIKAISVMLLIVLLFTGCTKSTATPGEETTANGTTKTYKVFSTQGLGIGSIVISKEAGGDARVILSIDKGVLSGRPAPYQAILTSSTLPTAVLQPVNAETGTSETYPVRSSNKGIIVSYDALMFMRDLRLVVADGQNAEIASADIH